ncbi:MAG: hypothetical protein ABSA58_17990 [Acetobacteraceae bacterium]|jgi:hypothetical protein
MNISPVATSSLYSAALTSQPSPVTRNNEGTRAAGSPEAKQASVNEASGKPGRLDVVT